jgi:hypothetical protein
MADHSMLVPRIKTRAFTAAIQEMNARESEVPYTEPLAADLLITYALDLPGAFMMANRSMLAEIGVRPEEARPVAIENLRRQLPEIGFAKHGPIQRVVTGGNLEACTLLAERLWDDCAAEMEGEIVAAVPSRDVVLFCSSSAPDAVAAMRQLAAEVFGAETTHRLTERLLVWRTHRWLEYDGQGTAEVPSGVPEVQIWPTLVGVVALTPEAFGFSYSTSSADIGKLRADLEAGVPMAKAVGFSGSCCSLSALHRVESRENSPTVVVVARDFLGKSKEDFTFRKLADRQRFYEALLRFLGPRWQCSHATRGSCVLMLLPIAGMLFGVFNMLCGGLLLALPPNPNPKPGVEPMPPAAMWGIMAFGLIVTAACIGGFFWARKLGRTTWETICVR